MNDWQSVKKLVHATDFGLDLIQYGFSQAEAKAINELNIIEYVAQGGKLPSTDLVRDYIDAIKMFCENNPRVIRNDTTAKFKGDPMIAFYDDSTRQIALFERDTKKFRTGYILTVNQAKRYNQFGSVGLP